MSGICGIVYFDGRPVEKQILRHMAEKAAYRGPHGIRSWNNGNAGLAHLYNNLSAELMDERQPLVVTGDGALVLCADARIDNRAELCSILGEGEPDCSPEVTDSRLILAAYRRWGQDCPAHLIGDFAFSIWDAKNQRILAARDPMAMRGFYYYRAGDEFIFATEIKQILAVPGVPRRLFEPAVGAYLIGPYALPEWTLYEGIFQLQPAHALSVEPGQFRIWRFWDIDRGYEIRYRRDEEYGEHFLEIFKESVRCRLSRSKKTGILLSGGVDSGAVASVAGWLSKNESNKNAPALRTYSWAFRELQGCDEREISSEIVGFYGLEHTDVEADGLWPLKDYPVYGPDLDDPYIDVYQPLHETTLKIALDQGIRTIITAERGDEMVGAWIYDLLGLISSWHWHEAWLEVGEHYRRSGRSVPGIIKDYVFQPWMRSKLATHQSRILKRLRTRLEGDPAVRVSPYPPWLHPDAARRIDLDTTIRKSFPLAPFNNDAKNRRYGLIFSPNSARRIRMEERTAARYGLGYCDPWSDLRLARFILAIPQWRVHSLCKYKRLVKEALRGIMPERVRRESKKTEPAALYELGIFDKSSGTIRNLITDMRAGSMGFVDEQALQLYYDSMLKRLDQRFDIWWPLTLEMWLRAHW